MSALQDLLEQKKALDQQITALRTAERQEAISKVRALMAEHGLTATDVQGSASGKAAKAGSTKKVAAKYRDPQTGSSWTGRGLKPRWLTEALSNGKSLADFAL
jgi:DNA-binding protein H-NS